MWQAPPVHFARSSGPRRHRTTDSAAPDKHKSGNASSDGEESICPFGVDSADQWVPRGAERRSSISPVGRLISFAWQVEK
jgi:hypothetical protein